VNIIRRLAVSTVPAAFAVVAQLVEQLIRNQQVAGSNPANGSRRMKSKPLETAALFPQTQSSAFRMWRYGTGPCPWCPSAFAVKRGRNVSRAGRPHWQSVPHITP
jgi:hypothetical protein